MKTALKIVSKRGYGRISFFDFSHFAPCVLFRSGEESSSQDLAKEIKKMIQYNAALLH